MNYEDKQLLLKDLCARLPYGIIIGDKNGNRIKLSPFHSPGIWVDDNWKPYLRPMSSMTEEEKKEYCDLQDKFLFSSQYPVTDGYALFDWLNAHHFDYRGLIPKGLAIEVNESNNPYKN